MTFERLIVVITVEKKMYMKIVIESQSQEKVT